MYTYSDIFIFFLFFEFLSIIAVFCTNGWNLRENFYEKLFASQILMGIIAYSSRDKVLRSM